ncbi:unnamed protein product [Closterium sp. NIES-65]|nr:unnamed protein product [Closterium sp. NIES-65]
MDKPPAFRDNSLHHRSKRPRQQDSHESNSTSGRRYVVAVHVGAGYHSKRYEQRYLRAMRDALAAAELVLRGAGGTSAEGQRGECAGAGEAGRLDAKNRASAPGSGQRVRMLAGEGALLWAQTHAPYAVARHPQDLVTPAAEGQWRKYRRIVGALEQHQGRKECVRAFRAVEKEEDLDEVRTEQGSMGTWGEDAKRERRDYGGWGKSTREGDEEDVEGIEGMGGEVDWTGGREEEGKTRVVGKGEEEGEEEGEEGEKEGEGEDEEEEEQEGPWDTVGAVCFEVASGAAAAASSGGIAFKAPGRVGCAAMHGAACWADASISTASNLPKSSAADPACSEAAQEISVRGDFHAAAVETESEHDQKQQQHQPQMLAVAASVSGAGEPIVECQLARCVCEAAMEGGESDPAAMGIARFNAHVAALSAALDDQQQRGETERKRQWPVASDVGLLLLSAYPQHKSPSGALLDPSSSAYSAGRSFPKSSSLLDDPAKFEAYEQLNLHQARSSRHPSVKAGRSSSSASSRGKLSVRWALEEGEEGHEGVGRRKSSVARVEEVDGEEMGEGDGLIGGEGGEGREEEGGVEGDGEGGGGRRRNGKLFRMLSADFCVGGENGGRSGAYGGRGMDEGSRNWGRGGRSIGGRGGWGGSMGWWRGWGRDAAEGGDVSDWGEGGSGGSGGRGGGGGGGGEGGGVGSNMKGIVGEGVALLDDEEVERMDDEVIQALFERVVEAQTQLHNYKNLVAFSLFTALYLLMLCLQDYSGDSSYSFASSSDFYTWLNNSIIQSECVGKRERACGGGKVVTVALRCHFALREAMVSSSWNLCSTAIRDCGDGVVTVALRCHFALREAMQSSSWNLCSTAIRDVCWFQDPQLFTEFTGWHTVTVRLPDNDWYVAGEWERVCAKIHTLSPPSHPFRFQDPQLFIELKGWHTVTVRLPDNDWFVSLTAPTGGVGVYVYESLGKKTTGASEPGTDSSSGVYSSGSAAEGSVMISAPPPLPPPPPPVSTAPAPAPFRLPSSRVSPSASPPPASPTASTFESTQKSTPPPASPTASPFESTQKSTPPPASPTASPFESTQKSTPPPASPTASPSTKEYLRPSNGTGANVLLASVDGCVEDGESGLQRCRQVRCGGEVLDAVHVQAGVCSGADRGSYFQLQSCSYRPSCPSPPCLAHTLLRCPPSFPPHTTLRVSSSAPEALPMSSPHPSWPAGSLLDPWAGMASVQLVCTLRQVLPMLSFSPADSSSPLHRPPHSSQPPKLPPCTSPTLPSPHPHPFSPPPPPATSSQPIAEAQRLVWESLGTTDGERIRVCQVAVARALYTAVKENCLAGPTAGGSSDSELVDYIRATHRSPSRRFSAAQQALFVRILVMALQSVVQKMPSGAVQAATHLLHIFNDTVVSPDASPCPQGASLFLLLSSAPMVFPGRKRFEEPCASQVGAFVITQELPPLPTILLSSLPGSPSSPPADFMVLWDSASFTRRAISDGQRVTWVWNDDDYHELSGVASKGREERETGEVWNGDDYHELSGLVGTCILLHLTLRMHLFDFSSSFVPHCSMGGFGAVSWFAYTKVFGTARDIAVKDSPQSLAFTLIRARNDSGTARNMKPRDSLPPYVLLLASLCAPACRLAMLANGRCDQQPRDSLPPYALLLASLCAPDCRLSMLANGRCDQPCNVALCDFDGGDCACGGAGSGSIGSSVSSGSDAAGAGGGSGRGGSGSGSSGGGASVGGSVGGGVGVQWCTCPVLQIRGDDGACCEAAGAGTGIKVPFSLQRFGPTVHPLLSTLGSTATALPRVVSQYNSPPHVSLLHLLPSPSPRLSVLMGFTIVQYLWHSSRSDLKPTKEAECDVMLAVSQPEPYLRALRALHPASFLSCLSLSCLSCLSCLSRPSCISRFSVLSPPRTGC